MKWQAVAFCFLTGALAQNAPDAPCATCHPREAAAHAGTRMAHAMVPAAKSAFAANLPQQPLHEAGGGYFFTYAEDPNGLEVSAYRGLDSGQGLIQWVLGAGAQGQTPLVRSATGIRESRVSYFPQLHQYGITVGQSAAASADAQSALGLKQNPNDLHSCLACHATVSGVDLQRVTPGIQCARCHAGAELHAEGKGHPANPGKFSAAAQVQLCGTCHRSKPPVGDNEPENIRFQPLRLMKSACFSSKALACTTCHPAHEDARRNDDGFYNAKCRTCHNEGAFHGSPRNDARRTGDCVACHMPKVQLHPALTFTDHDIRVVQEAGKLAPG